ncbi:hypothetical protein IAG25_03565 [Caballeronia sp. EK]|uniref:WD40/YVTN/BNR-like repeat-containing protein n=1 Tax=Caballeronia sp. EK TaxID=2767469 RepID=UPI0016558C94|nr:hypothetical protein [Caballeronia sp. EK]MBC8635874.1 hypothetical protein [Caballeronia sp. EK]
MNRDPTKELFFNVGAARDGEDFFLAGLFYELEGTDTECTRVMAFEAPDYWFYLDDVDGIVTMLLAFRRAGKLNTMAITRTGHVANFIREKRTDAQIPIDPGFLFYAVAAGTDVFACGSQNQIWRWNGKTWSRAGTGANVNQQIGAATALFGMCAQAEDDVHAVGSGGTILHFDGTSWAPVDSPTNVALHRVLNLGGGELFVVGRFGQVFRGSAESGWFSLAIEGMTENFWGLCRFGQAIYCSTSQVLYRVQDDRLVRVDTGDNGPKSIARLFTNDQYMWLTTGTDAIFRFDGAKWEEIVCPENT